MTIDGNGIISALIIATLVGLGTAVWAATIALTKLGARFDAHQEADAAAFQAIREDVKDVREIAHAALYGGEEHRR